MTVECGCGGRISGTGENKDKVGLYSVRTDSIDLGVDGRAESLFKALFKDLCSSIE